MSKCHFHKCRLEFKPYHVGNLYCSDKCRNDYNLYCQVNGRKMVRAIIDGGDPVLLAKNLLEKIEKERV